jgi:hypothetical protein
MKGANFNEISKLQYLDVPAFILNTLPVVPPSDVNVNKLHIAQERHVLLSGRQNIYQTCVTPDISSPAVCVNTR